MRTRQCTCHFFTVSGTGVSVEEVAILPKQDGGNAIGGALRYTGNIRRIVIREEAGGLATAATFYLVHNLRSSVTSPSTEPAENVVVVTSSVPLTASASAASLDSAISAEPAFTGSLLLVADVTAATGAWSLTGFVEVEV